jgi:hypothetical protein
MPNKMNLRYRLPLILIITAVCTYLIEINQGRLTTNQPNDNHTNIEYDRKLYKHWIDEDKDCQDTRQEVLISESIEPVILDDKGCRVISGRWYDPFTGNTFADPSDLDIDHLVPLKEAHLSGAHSWTEERRRFYANDLSNEDSLIAVSKSANRSKGAKDVALWLPPNKYFHCEYVRRWVAVKETWGLVIDEIEADAIAPIMAKCRL